jgi:DNA repair protein RecN (Recombination protein N)
VGRKLKKVGERHQVLCITHLPQVAVFADNHLRVEKQVEHGRTATTVTPLDKKSRIDEISRMLGGSKITDTTRQHAIEMLTSTEI